MISKGPIKTLPYNKFFPLLFSLLLTVSNSYSQVKIFERPPLLDKQNAGLSYESSTRQKLDLNGEWDLSFNNGETFSKVSVPIAYEFSGIALFKKQFTVTQDVLSNYSFILVAEGIVNESSIRINDVFIANNKNAFIPIVIPIDDEIIRDQNIIEISVNSELSITNSIPLANQLNYSRLYGGITKDIYIIAVPKVSVLSSDLRYRLSGYNNVTFENKVNVKSSSLDGFNSNFGIKTEVIDKETGATVYESPVTSFTVDNFQSITVDHTFNFPNPRLWSFEQPNLYIFKTQVIDSSGVVDESVTEIGIRRVQIKGQTIFINGKEYNLKGINYYEDSPDYASALDYYGVERDLKKIKDLGINCIRVPGRTLHPYIVNICNNIGILLFCEIPFNEVPSALLRKDEYVESGLNYLDGAIQTYKNNPSIIAWGIGNNFDVTKSESADYVRMAKERSAQLDSRPVYYTTKNFTDDRCEEFADFRGLDLFGNKMENLKDFIASLYSNLSKLKNKPGKPVFIASYGLNIENENRNGARDHHSIEAQAQYLIEVYKVVSKQFFINFISSYADWNAERPLNYRQNYNPYLQTNGIFTIYREPKQAALFIKRIINNQDAPKILEGNSSEDDSQFFLIAGIILNIGLIFLIFNVRKFQEYSMKSLLRPTNFFQFASEQMLIPTTLNILLCLLISFGLGLFFSSVFYFYRESILFDMILANVWWSDSLKILFSEVTNSPLYSIFFITGVFFLMQILVSLLIFVFSFFLSGRAYYKNVFTVTVWSALQMVIFLPIGAVIFKLAQVDTEYVYLSFILFIILLIIYIIRIIKGARTVYNLHSFKAYSYGLAISVIIFGGLYAYFYFIKHTQYIISLINSYLKG